MSDRIHTMNRLSVGRKVTLFVLERPKLLAVVQKVYKVKGKLPMGYRKIVKSK